MFHDDKVLVRIIEILVPLVSTDYSTLLFHNWLWIVPWNIFLGSDYMITQPNIVAIGKDLNKMQERAYLRNIC
jgi:hypothetical protein